jgi:hypothetical protein
MARRGRPTFSVIRQNMVEVLHFMGEAYGYQIYKAYKDLFDPITLRVIYYHLKKGKELGEFVVAGIKKTEGTYSWGPEAERIFYKLGENAKPKVDERVKEYLDKKK